jgi:hypothetical protein
MRATQKGLPLVPEPYQQIRQIAAFWAMPIAAVIFCTVSGF